MKIITLTLNPAFDLHCDAPNFQPYHENLAHVTSNEAGGKGVNISRALTACGVENTALVVLGDENGDLFRRALQNDQISFCEIPVTGRIRENITLHTPSAPETRISFPGFAAQDELIDRVEHQLRSMLSNGDILTLTGRNPEGVSMDRVKSMLIGLQKAGVKIVLDSRSFTKQDVIDVRPWLIKPNEEEIASYAEIPVENFNDARQAAEMLRRTGIENVMISLGGKGALLCCESGCYAVPAPKINVRSTVGAGDSSIGGFCAAAKAGLDFPDMLRYAVAFGSAACMTVGTKPPSAEAIRQLLPTLTVSIL